jgi:hypothetical protein
LAKVKQAYVSSTAPMAEARCIEEIDVYALQVIEKIWHWRRTC